MKRILKFEVEIGETFSCEECPFGVKCWNEDYGEWEYKCDTERNPFDCDRFDLSTLKLIEENEESS